MSAVMVRELTQEGKEQLGLALLLLRDLKRENCKPENAADIFAMVTELASHCGVLREFQDLLGKVPPMTIQPK